MFRQGYDPLKLELVLSKSEDGGKTWNTNKINGEIPIYYNHAMGPGISISPNGTIDVVFFAYGKNAPDCIQIPGIDNGVKPGKDTCLYDVYYIYSKNNGDTFSPPIRLNLKTIDGNLFMRPQGISIAGEYIGIASTNAAAYPIWIETNDKGPQATIRIINR